MNYNRRNFLATTTLAVAGVALSRCSSAVNNNGQKPIVISTWDFGISANAEAWKILSNKGTALDAVENGVKITEADPKVQTVGYGGFPDRDGKVTLDACIMDYLGNCGAVAALENIKHPIAVARLVMEKTPHVFLVGEGAKQFALAHGFKAENLLTEESKAAWEQWLKTAKYTPQANIENQSFRTTPDKLPGNQYNHDTIGMLALDSFGNLAGACTTSGMAYKLHGRVGDSPIIGAGLYVDNEVGAATSTGVGEEVIRNVGSFLVVELMRQGYSPEEACKEAVLRIIKKKKNAVKNLQVGFLALNKKGNYGAYAIQKDFSFAVCNENKQDLLLQSKSNF